MQGLWTRKVEEAEVHTETNKARACCPEQMRVACRHHGEEHCINYSSLLDQILDKKWLKWAEVHSESQYRGLESIKARRHGGQNDSDLGHCSNGWLHQVKRKWRKGNVSAHWDFYSYSIWALRWWDGATCVQGWSSSVTDIMPGYWMVSEKSWYTVLSS